MKITVALLSLVAIGACNPALNWRQAGSETSPIRMMLPCKPDKATREVAMGAQALQLDMQGCDAGGATFAVSHVRLANAADAQATLAGWRAAVLAHLHASSAGEPRPFAPMGAVTLPQSVRLQATGRTADGKPLVVDAAWFARLDATGVHLFHAAMFAPHPMPDVAETFFSGIGLQ